MNRYVRLALLPVLFLAFAPAAVADADEDYAAAMRRYRAGDLVTAIPPLRRAAEAGHVEAQLQLAYILDWSEENALAIDYYRRAAEAGEPRGALALSRMFASGETASGRSDPDRALEWLERAADAGHPPAITELGRAYLDGRFGLKADRARARALLERARTLGHEAAGRMLDELAAERSAADSVPPATPR